MKTFAMNCIICLVGFTPPTKLSAQNYTPQTKQEMVDMLAKRCDENPVLIEKILAASAAVESIYHIPASVVLSIMIMESNGLQSTTSKVANNCMGLTKSDDWHGPVYCEYQHYWNGIAYKNEEVETCYRAYERLEDSIFDFAYFITNERRWWYNDAFEKCAMDDTACWIEAFIMGPNEPRSCHAVNDWGVNCLNMIKVYNLKLADNQQATSNGQ